MFEKALKFLLLLSTCFAMPVFNRVVASGYYEIEILSGIDPFHRNIESAARDKQGFIWFVAGSLLYRYDGVAIKAFNELYTEPLGFTEVNKLTTDDLGRLWLETRNGLFIFDTQLWQFIEKDTFSKGLVGEDIIALSNQGKNLFVATRSGILWQISGFRKKKLMEFQPALSELRRPIGKSLIADESRLWFAYNSLLFFVDLKSGKTQQVQMPKRVYRELDDLFLLENGLLLRNYGLGYMTFDGREFHQLHLKGLNSGDMRDWAHWSFAETEKIIFLFGDGRYFEFRNNLEMTLLRQDKHDIRSSLFKSRLNQLDFNGHEGLCATENGLYSLVRRTFELDYWNTGTARAIVKQQDKYYVGGYAPLKYFMSNNLAIKESAPLNNYYAFLPIDKDTALVGLEGNFLGLLANGKFRSLSYKKAKGTLEDLSTMVYSLCHYRENSYLLGTSCGLWIYNRDTGSVSPLRDNMGKLVGMGERVNSIQVRQQVISFTTENGYFEYLAGQLRKIYPQKSEKLQVYSHSFRHNKVFLATKGKGLIAIDASTGHVDTYNTNGGLAHNVVFNMAWVDDLLFLGTFRGLSVWDGKNFYNAYAMHGLPFEEFNQASILEDKPQGQLFIGGVLGCIAIQPQQFLYNLKQETVPPPVLSTISMGTSSGNIVTSFTPKDGQDTLIFDKKIEFANLRIAKIDAYKQNYKIYFRLRPLIKSFQEVPASGEINLSDLKTGEYELELKTISDNGLSVKTKRWLFYKKPKFYETQLFYVLVTLGLGVVLYVIAILRSSQLKRDKKLRLELARDLHDEVGGLLTGIAMQTDLMAIGQQSAGRHQSLEKIAAYSREAVQTMDDVIWAIDSRNNSQGSLEDRMRFLVSQILPMQDVDVKFDINLQSAGQLPQYVRQNVYLIFKEALHNICKHSPNAKVDIFLKIDRHQLILRLCNTIQLTEGTISHTKYPRHGQGTANMKRRAEAIGAKFEAERSATRYRIQLAAKLNVNKLFLDFFN
ncbi:MULTISPECIES: sensor histidine kinase [Sphingobacterium]|uniref:sensor histidine kinase n=1 Tax=Sphingobacterium TaxID=28453 RepID=UPI00129CF34F|nr:MULTISPECIES: histidine kinase [Sphingobacterium]